MRSLTHGIAVLAVVFSTPLSAFAHCEIPCGIYGDRMRIDMLSEDITTIEKSMTEIKKLSVQDDANINQLVRWINNKETHASKIEEVVTQYFMNQRVKPANQENTEAYSKYVKQITLLHRMLVASMKAKQSVDLSYVATLRNLLSEFDKAYFGEPEDNHPGHKH